MGKKKVAVETNDSIVMREVVVSDIDMLIMQACTDEDMRKLELQYPDHFAKLPKLPAHKKGIFDVGDSVETMPSDAWFTQQVIEQKKARYYGRYMPATTFNVSDEELAKAKADYLVLKEAQIKSYSTKASKKPYELPASIFENIPSSACLPSKEVAHARYEASYNAAMMRFHARVQENVFSRCEHNLSAKLFRTTELFARLSALLPNKYSNGVYALEFRDGWGSQKVGASYSQYWDKGSSNLYTHHEKSWHFNTTNKHTAGKSHATKKLAKAQIKKIIRAIEKI